MQNLGLISIIDDEERVRRATSSLVRSLGYEALSFGSAEEFLGSSTARSSACVVSDILMPGMTGIELYERLAATGNAIPFVFMTASPEDAVRHRLGKHGCILQKPFDADRLIALIETVIKDSSSRRSRPGSDSRL